MRGDDRSSNSSNSQSLTGFSSAASQGSAASRVDTAAAPQQPQQVHNVKIRTPDELMADAGITEVHGNVVRDGFPVGPLQLSKEDLMTELKPPCTCDDGRDAKKIV